MKKWMVNFIQSFFMYFGVQIVRKKQGIEYRYLLNKKRYKEQTVKLLGKDFLIADGASFYYSYHEIFTENIYKFKASSATPFILDCGSNYGTSIVYFKHLYPNAKIIGFEPDPQIHRILSTNIANRGLTEVEVLNYGLWKEETTLTFASEGADGGRISSQEGDSDSIHIKTKVLSAFLKNEKVDLLKIDIEGAEVDVLIEAKPYLQNVDHIFIEFHSFEGQPQRLNELLDVLETSGFRYYMQTQFGSKTPFVEVKLQLGMDLQLNIFAIKKANS